MSRRSLSLSTLSVIASIIYYNPAGVPAGLQPRAGST